MIKENLKLCRKKLHYYTGSRCSECYKIVKRRQVARNRTYEDYSPECKLIKRSNVPQKTKLFIRGFWERIINAVNLLYFDEALKIPINVSGICFTNFTILIKHAKQANVKIGFLFDEGYLYIWRVK